MSNNRKAPDGNKTAYLEVGIWYNENSGHIHMSAPGSDGFISTVNDEEGSVRRHRHLYWKLASVLEELDLPHPQRR